MSSPRVAISPSVLTWATRRTGLTDNELSKKFPKFEEWLEGKEKPTLPQARALAKAARLPFGRLLLDEPTGEDVGLPDFRTVNNSEIDELSPDLQEVVTKAQQRLAWYSEYAMREGVQPPSLLSSVIEGTGAETAANAARQSLGLEAFSPIAGSHKVRTLVALMESNGILVARNSIVENSTKRPLAVEEFRGFTIVDDGFCLVFINTRDSKTAQLFSLAHELGHVVSATPGLSDHSKNVEVERWCNKFAAEFIVPAGAVKNEHNSGRLLMEEVKNLGQRFGMSREAMLWRLVELKLCSQEEANEVLPLIKGDPRDSRKDSGGAPPHHVLVRARVGGRFYDTVTQAAENGQISQRDAARYLGAANYESFMKLVETRNLST
ncbi:ImmA/IrrE family metallo-endopeptidase [Corynebacterium pilosum]|uniref:Domain of uncharacterized function (DUF955) n=1 Tax=Corynebacterium pilosum TaxID=35756 RepID=A0A376CKB6_9CORY|nr:ImmA/IrrE family metallo-endopeptidase [Corynebacterium pilosum]STC68529.1 Domain of uncharacterised function (DUF955) [Corynebacterium pilosum]